MEREEVKLKHPSLFSFVLNHTEKYSKQLCKAHRMTRRLIKAGSKRKYAYWAFRNKPLFGLKWPKITIDTDEFHEACKGVTESFKRLSEATARVYGLKEL